MGFGSKGHELEAAPRPASSLLEEMDKVRPLCHVITTARLMFNGKVQFCTFEHYSRAIGAEADARQSFLSNIDNHLKNLYDFEPPKPAGRRSELSILEPTVDSIEFHTVKCESLSRADVEKILAMTPEPEIEEETTS